jgi:hypothetical protein
MKITIQNFMKIIAHDFTSKIGEMYASVARDAHKPVEKAGANKIAETLPPLLDH